MISVEYLSGFFDGEGTIGLAPKGSGFVLRISISNTHPGVLEEIKATFGGNVMGPKKGVNQPIYQWIVANSAAIVLLEKMSPFLVVKKQQAELAIETKKYRLGPGAWKGERADLFREKIVEIRQTIMALNGQGGNKAQAARSFGIHPATLSTQKGWDRGLYRGGKSLTHQDAVLIRSQRGKKTQNQLADEFGVSQSTISAIMVGKTWKYLSEQRVDAG